MCVCVKHLNRCKTSTSIVFSCVCLSLNLNFNFVGFTAHLHVLCFIDCNQFPDDSAREFRRIQRSFAWFVVSSILITSQTIQQGDHPCAVCDGPTKRPQYMRISRLITVTYLPSCCFKGFSSQRITEMIHSYQVCAGVSVFGLVAAAEYLAKKGNHIDTT